MGGARGGEPRDLRFLRRQLVDGVRSAPSGALAGRLQLDPGALRERLHPEVGEELARDTKLGARIHPATLATQPLTVQEVGAGEVDRDPRSAEAVDGLEIQLLRLRTVRQERTRARRDPQGPV